MMVMVLVTMAAAALAAPVRACRARLPRLAVGR